MRSSSPASISLYLDSDVLRIPFQAILPTLCAIKKDTKGRNLYDKKGIISLYNNIKLKIMRTIILFLSFTLVFVSCKKDDNTDSTKVYTDSKGTSISLTDSKWFTTKSGNSDNGFGNVNLSISGTTNVDKVTIETYGDGLKGDFDLVLDSKKNFKKDSIGISFTHYSGTLPTNEFESSTKIKAIKGSDTLVVTLNSGKLKY